MTADPSIDPAGFLAVQLECAELDLLRAMLKTFVVALMGADADAICGAPYRSRSQERTNSGNGLPGPGVGHPQRARWSSRSPNCGRVPTSRTGCSSGAAAPSAP